MNLRETVMGDFCNSRIIQSGVYRNTRINIVALQHQGINFPSNFNQCVSFCPDPTISP